jgi:hypothetical protein
LVSNGLALTALYASVTWPCDTGGMELGMKQMLIGAAMIGGAGGYVWSDVFASRVQLEEPTIRASKNRQSPALIEVPPTQADAAADKAWASGQPSSTSPGSAGTTARPRQAIAQDVTYSGCDEVRALGKAPLFSDQPGYRSDMDGDGDGVACEPIR